MVPILEPSVPIRLGELDSPHSIGDKIDAKLVGKGFELHLWVDPGTDLGADPQEPRQRRRFLLLATRVVEVGEADECAGGKFVGDDPAGSWGVAADMEVEFDGVNGLGFCGEGEGEEEGRGQEYLSLRVWSFRSTSSSEDEVRVSPDRLADPPRP